VFVSYSHDSQAHKDRILALCDRLRREGVHADLDQYVGAPSEGWPRWTMRQIETADFVLVVCTETYRRRFDGTEEKGRGLGATWEGAVLTQVHYDAAAASGRLVPVVFASEDDVHVPTVLHGLTRYDLSAETGYEQLYRHLTGQPSTPRPGLGTVIALPPRARASDFPLAPPAAARWKWRLWLATAGVLAAVLVGHLAPARKTESRTVDPVTPAPMHLLRGEILDAKTHLPLPRVLVRLPELSLQATTDDQGQYRFEVAVPAGAQVKLRASREGYEPINADPPAGSDHLDTYRMWRNR
jgi:hypothetical protein